MVTIIILASIISGCYYLGYTVVAKRLILPYDARQMGLPRNYEMACNWNEIRVFNHYSHDMGYIFPKNYTIYNFPDTGLTGVFKDIIFPQSYKLSTSPDALWYTDTLYQVIEVSTVKYYTLMSICTIVPGTIFSAAALGLIVYLGL